MTRAGAEPVDAPGHGAAGAVEANLAAWLANFARLPGGELREEADAVWFVTGRASWLLNGVIRARFAPGGAAARTGALLDALRRRGAPFAWWTGPGTRPFDLGERLVAHGLRRELAAPGMVADLRALPAPAPPPGAVVERVRDAAGLEAWHDGGRSPLFEAHLALGLGEDAPLRHYVGFLEGRPVAKASLFLSAESAGLYNVSVAPADRRRGLGTAVALAPLLDARRLGYTVGVLSATPMAIGLYRRLGFREAGAVACYAEQGEPA
jgi:ribosomal protein S18 acetylase RimI-like enzyme